MNKFKIGIVLWGIFVVIIGIVFGVMFANAEWAKRADDISKVICNIANMEYEGYTENIKNDINKNFTPANKKLITEQIESKLNSKYIDVTDLVMNAKNEHTRGKDSSIVELEEFKWYIDKTKVEWVNPESDSQEIIIYDLSYIMNKSELEMDSFFNNIGDEKYKYTIADYKRSGTNVAIQLESEMCNKYIKLSFNSEGLIDSIEGLLD